MNGSQSVGRFASLFPESIETLVNTFLPLLTSLLQSTSTCDRVRGHAASALINLLDPETCESAVLERFLEPLLAAMVQTFHTASIDVQAPCLNLLGYAFLYAIHTLLHDRDLSPLLCFVRCIAKVSSEAFKPYYGAFMPGVKSILASATAPEQILLRGKAMECAGIIGEAVGKTLFAPDAVEIMHALLAALVSRLSPLRRKGNE